MGKPWRAKSGVRLIAGKRLFNVASAINRRFLVVWMLDDDRTISPRAVVRCQPKRSGQRIGTVPDNGAMVTPNRLAGASTHLR